MFRSFAASCLTVCTVLLVIALLDPTRPSAAERAATRKEARHALLIGPNTFPNLDKRFWLNGPGNDVHLMAKALRELFGFPTESITILSDEAAKARANDNLLPTKANIQREFERLARISKAGDKVVILLAGHGTLVPQGENSPHPRPDGMRAAFLPRDVGNWDDSSGKEVKNAIVEDELAVWLGAIQNTRATIWLTFDAPHCGAITQEQSPVARLSNKPGLVAFCACKGAETTLEREMPMKSKDAKPYGLFTYTLVQKLQQANERSRKPLTYRELVQSVQTQYFAWGRNWPTPLVEGADSDREVLGVKEWRGRSSITLARGDNGLTVSRGDLHGLTRDSILAVFPPPGQGDKVQGHVKVTEVRSIDADVEPCAFEMMPLVDKLPLDGVCTLVYLDRGDQKLALGLYPKWKDGNKDKSLDDNHQERLLKTLAKLNEPRPGASPDELKIVPLVKLVADPGMADWLVRPIKDGAQFVLQSRNDFDDNFLRELAGGVASSRQFGPFPDDENLFSSIAKSAEQIVRYENLRKLAGGVASAVRKQGIQFKMDVRRAKDRTDKEGTYPIPWPATNVTFYDKDVVVLKITNTGQTPIDCTALSLDSDYRISCIWPTREEVNRLGPGETYKLPRVVVNSATVGMEHLVVIAVKSQGPPVSFAYLEQPGWTIARDLGKQTARDSPLGKMFQKALYNEGNVRGLKMAEVDDYAMTLLSWEIRPGRRPAEKPSGK